jgi:hypothetical protein
MICGLFIPDPDPDFFPISDPGVKKPKRHRIPDPGSRSATLNDSKGSYKKENDERSIF